MGFEISNSYSFGISNDAFDKIKSPQYLLAMAQMELSKKSKVGAKSLIEEVQSNQEKNKSFSKLIADVNSAIGSDDTDEGKRTRATALHGLKDRCVKLGISPDSEYFKGNSISALEANKLVTSLQGLQEEFGTKNQTIMVQVQHSLGEYNAYLEGANNAVQGTNSVTRSLVQMIR